MFDELLSEKLIEWIWILTSAGVVIFGLLVMFAGGGFIGFLMAVMYIVIGLLLARVVCEAMLVGFKMHDNNKRSLAVMEQMRREQTATRKAIQTFLEQTARVQQQAVQPVVAAPPAPTVPAAPRVAQSRTQGSVESAYHSNTRQANETEVDHSGPVRSRLGEWPGNTSGQ